MLQVNDEIKQEANAVQERWVQSKWRLAVLMSESSQVVNTETSGGRTELSHHTANAKKGLLS